jgi:hypothetical protein
VTVSTDAGTFTADVVLATGPIDEMLGYRHGPLEWRGYRVEPEVVSAGSDSRLGRAPDGVPFSWVYTPWRETEVARTTDFGVIHHGADAADDHPSVEQASASARVIPLGRLGLYKYVTIDTTYEMVRRLLANLERYLGGRARERFDVLREVRGDWDN